MTVTATNSGGSASTSFKVSVVGAKPAVVTAPNLSGNGKIGLAVMVDAGDWSGQPAPTMALQWQRDGAEHQRRHRVELHPSGGGRPHRADL